MQLGSRGSNLTASATSILEPHNIGALILIPYTILEVPYCNYSLMGPRTLLIIIKAPIVDLRFGAQPPCEVL